MTSEYATTTRPAGAESPPEPISGPSPAPEATGTRSRPADGLTALIAKRIRTHRERAGWTLTRLAEQIRDTGLGAQLTGNQIGKIETGKRDLSILELAAIAEALDVPAADLIRPGTLCPTCGQETPA